RFAASVERAADPDLDVGPNRRARAETREEPAQADEDERPLTQAVLDLRRGGDEPEPEGFARQDSFVETAVFQARALAAAGAPGFRNARDTDPALPENREWAGAIQERMAASTLGEERIAAARIETQGEVNSRVIGVKYAAGAWGAR